MTKPDFLPRSTPEEQGIASAAVLDFVEAIEAANCELHSFILLRHGQAAAEGWWAPYAPQHPHILFSLTKSFTCTAVGLAVAEGRLTIDDAVLDFFPEDAPKRPSQNLRAMRVRHLLSMTTGHLVDSTEKAVSNRQGNWVKGFLSMPVKHKPGAPFVYNSGASHMLSAIVQKVTGMALRDYLKPRLFDPLGIETISWDTDPRGINIGGWGLSLRTEEIARFGQMYLQKGMWNGRRILPEKWAAMATAKQVRNDVVPEGPLDWKQGYGFQFWRCQHNAYRGDGAFGQYCIVMPDQDAVLAITSGVNDMQAVLSLVWQHILPAFGSAALPVDAESQNKLSARLAGLKLEPPQGGAAGEPARLTGQRTYDFETNPIELRSMHLEFTHDHYQVTMENSFGQHALECGIRQWVLGRTSLSLENRRHGRPYVAAAHPVAAACAWTAEDTLEIQACFYETPFTYKITCQFEGNQVTLQNRINVSFGPTELPTLVGRLR
jgi:CubicO group peptidase (beta-lactamase class C family)